MHGEPRISVCGVMEYPCAGRCGDYIREHEAVWVRRDGALGVTGGLPYCPQCAPASATRFSQVA